MDGKLCWAMNFFRQRIDHLLLLLLLPKMKLLPVYVSACCVYTAEPGTLAVRVRMRMPIGLGEWTHSQLGRAVISKQQIKGG